MTTAIETALPSAEEHWVDKDGVRLFLWHKPALPGVPARGSLLFVHGSSMASQPCFDLLVPDRPDSSAMDWFAARGFATWALDSEGYGRSDKHRDRACGIDDGVADLDAAVAYIGRLTGDAAVHLYGISSGALKAACFASANPGRTRRLALEAMVWRGDDSPTLRDRRKHLAAFQSSRRRALKASDIEAIFARDRVGVSDPTTVKAFADAVLALDTSVPNGTFIDMCTRLPLVMPAALTMPTLVLRGQYDGIASEADVMAFFSGIANQDKQLVFLSGVAHGSLHGRRYQATYHVIHAFLTQPGPAP